MLITPASKPCNIGGLLAAKGFHIDYDAGSGMAVEITSSIMQIKTAGSISVIPVKDPDMLRLWMNIVSTALFEDNLFSFKQFHDLFMLDNTYFYLGLLDGKPASTCMTITGGDVATVEMVSTLKEFRIHGLGYAVTATALQGLYSNGVKTAILRAEKEAVNLYNQIGFTEFYKRIIANYVYV